MIIELFGVVAQLVERVVRNDEVRGSTPLGSILVPDLFWQQRVTLRFSLIRVFRCGKVLALLSQ
jgi:hypothetical protein